MRSLAIPLLLLSLGQGAAEARTIHSMGRKLDFTFAWPTLPAGLPRLEARLAREAAGARARARRAAAHAWAMDRDDSGDDPPMHSFDKKWTIRATTPRLLALEGDVMIYTGGAHEGIGYDALLWDRRTDRALTLTSLYAQPARALARMEKAYCAELESEQRERRGEGFSRADFRCPAMAKEPVVLTGRAGRITGFEVLLQPYAAGSWAEGPYEVEVRFDRELIKLLKPEFAPSFGT